MSNAANSVLSILLVEDSPADGRLLVELLKPASLAGQVIVQTVKSLKLAQATLQSSEFSCVLLDLGLPDGRGVDNVRVLRELDRKTAIIVLTGLADEKLAAEALKLGAQDYLVKGESDGEQLLKQLRRAVQRNRQTFVLETRRDQAFFEASHDALTLLPNVALFTDRARQQLSAARSAGQVFRLARLKVHGLAELRQSYGAPLADTALKAVSERLLDGLLVGDTLARTGEAEFGLLMQSRHDSVGWKQLLESQQQRLAAFQQLGDCMLSLQLAQGLSESLDGQETLEDLYAQAEPALIAASLEATVATVSSGSVAYLGSESKRWLPWMDVISGRSLGFLMEVESTPPLEPEAAAASILEQAQCLAAQAQQWLASAPASFVLALTLPPQSLQWPELDAALVSCIKASGWPLSAVQLHISEAAFRQLSQALPVLTRLRSAGFQLVMAGDGTQTISLQDFSAFALDGYKLSPALTQRLLEENLQGGARRMISAILGASQQLGATVLASGVDSPECIAALRLIGVRQMQGQAVQQALSASQVLAVAAQNHVASQPPAEPA